jgi:carbon-monoxide dehydrogenase large subunit
LTGGAALVEAGKDLKRKLAHVAAHLLAGRPEDVVIEGGHAFLKGTNTRLPIAGVAEAAYRDAGTLAAIGQSGLVSTGRSEVRGPVYSNGTHAAIVEVDPDTGQVTIKRYVDVEDCGPLINPMIVEGQARGAVVQGIGGALFEEIVYDGSGQPLTTTLLDYLVPVAAGIPDIEVHHLETPPPPSMGRFKAVGEGGVGAATAAIANAIADALAPYRPRLTRLPLKPDRLLVAMGRIRAAS